MDLLFYNCFLLGKGKTSAMLQPSWNTIRVPIDPNQSIRLPKPVKNFLGAKAIYFSELTHRTMVFAPHMSAYRQILSSMDMKPSPLWEKPGNDAAFFVNVSIGTTLLFRFTNNNRAIPPRPGCQVGTPNLPRWNTTLSCLS